MYWRLKNNDIITISDMTFYDIMTDGKEIKTPYYIKDSAIYRTEDNVRIQGCKMLLLEEIPHSENVFELLPGGSLIIYNPELLYLKNMDVWSEVAGIMNVCENNDLIIRNRINKMNFEHSIKLLDDRLKSNEIKEIYIPTTYAGRQAYIKII